MFVRTTSHCLCITLLISFTPAVASEAEDLIADCARISSTGDRILCLEDALRSQPTTVEAVEAVEEPEVSAEDPASTDGNTAGVAAAAAAVAIADELPAGDETEVESEPATAVATMEPQPELGAEQVARQNDVDQEEVRISAVITEHSLVGTGRLRLTLDNGQVWQQTGDDDDRVARRIRGETAIAVEMWQSRSGGYRMQLLEVDRTLRVRRIR